MRKMIAIAGTAALLLSACGGGETTKTKETTPAEEPTTAETTTPAEEPGTVTVAGFAFSPRSTEVPAGTEVTWMNQDDAPHTATADDGSFDVQLEPSGGSGSFTFEEPGTYAYICSIHPSMTGEVVVA